MSRAVTVKVVREVSDEKLIHGPVRKFVADAVTLVTNKVQNRAPIDAGNLQGSLEEGAGVTVTHDDHGLVGTNVTYGRILNESKRTHYVRTQPFVGERTKGWFDRGVDDAMPKVRETLLPNLASSIEAAWRA